MHPTPEGAGHEIHISNHALWRQLEKGEKGRRWYVCDLLAGGRDAAGTCHVFADCDIFADCKAAHAAIVAPQKLGPVQPVIVPEGRGVTPAERRG